MVTAYWIVFHNEKVTNMKLQKIKIWLCVAAVLCTALCGCTLKEINRPSEVATVEETSGVPEEASSTTDDSSQTGLQTEALTTEAVPEIEEDVVSDIMSDMTLREKICQMMFVTPESITGTDNVTVAGDATKQALEQYPVGGIVYFAENLESREQTMEMIANSQSYSEIGLFIAVDEEGGTVNRVMDRLGTTYIDSMYLYKDEGPEKAYDNACTIATDIASLGFNVDFAPVADVWSNPSNTVIGERAYSDDFAESAALVEKAVKGFHDGGVMTSLKHFPGHGDTAEDSHEGNAYTYKTKAQIMDEEMQPFKAGIAAGSDFVMVGHITAPDIDDLPATLSYEITTKLLREELGFTGIAITDSMAMGSIVYNYGAGEAAAMAVKAGIDMILAPSDVEAAVLAIESAVENGEINEDRIDQSVYRILTLKQQWGLLN